MPAILLLWKAEGTFLLHVLCYLLIMKGRGNIPATGNCVTVCLKNQLFENFG